MDTFSPLSHTADIGEKVWGRTLEELFINAARGLFSYLIVPMEETVSFRTEVAVEGIDRESLLVNWLNELLYIAYRNNVFLISFTIKQMEDTSLKAEVGGKRLLPGARFTEEIKAATYSSLAIRKTEEGFYVEVIFDV